MLIRGGDNEPVVAHLTYASRPKEFCHKFLGLAASEYLHLELGKTL